MNYTVTIHTDEDWGLHKADPGFSIGVSVDEPGRIEGEPSDITIPLACERLGITPLAPFEVFEGCEDEDPSMLEIAELADRIRDEILEKVTVNLTPADIETIGLQYPGRDNRIFQTSWSYWRRKLPIDK
jgi:hypothetical protein